MGCKYRFNNKVYNSYQSLIEEFSDGDIQSALAILYSLEMINRLYYMINQINLKRNINSQQIKNLLQMMWI